MRAARIYGRGDVRIDEIDEPEVGPAEVKVRVSFNGMCGSDLHEYFHGPRLVPVGARHPVSGALAPVVLGHEAAGYVVEVGPSVTGPAVGDLVAIEPLLSCGSCVRCRTGHYNLCPAQTFHGLNTGGGGLAEYAVIPAANAHVVPATVLPRDAALVEPLAVSHHAVHQANPVPGKTAVVHGAGPIGIGAFLVLRNAGVDATVVEPSPTRRAAVVAVGCRTAIDPVEDDVTDAVLQATGGRGVDISIDAVGTPSTFAAALASTAPGGEIVVVGAGATSIEVPIGALFNSEASIVGSLAYCGDFPAVIEAMAQGAFPSESWSSILPLDELVPDGFEMLRDATAVKLLVDVGAASS